MIKHIIDVALGKTTLNKKRSKHWKKFRKAFLAKNPECAACGSKKRLEAHHIKPFHLHPELELDDDNLITLCRRRSRNCHRIFGHCMNWRYINNHARMDAGYFLHNKKSAREAYNVHKRRLQTVFK